jgi:hypothetical protein
MVAVQAATTSQVTPAAVRGPAPLNPERPPQLLGKYAKLLGKDLKQIVVTYDVDGVNVAVTGMGETPFASLDDAAIADYKAMKQKENTPSDEERLNAFRNKFELRLNKEFPKEGTDKPASGSEADIQAFLNRMPFKERRALLMTQKQFSVSYPNGYSQA